MRILQINTLDQTGGAEKVALGLHQAYLDLGHDARLLVKRKSTATPQVVETDPYLKASPWSPACRQLERLVRRLPKFRGQGRLVAALRLIARPQRWLDYRQGLEDFNYPDSHFILADHGWRPDVIQPHNLHGEYFDLRALPVLSHRVPVVWTLHDAWALTGHCAHFAGIGCERWRFGCGGCPDLSLHPPVRRDNTARNWERKRSIYHRSCLAVATPSRWLLDLVEGSLLHPWQKKVIPNGVDLNLFRLGDRRLARQNLGLPLDAFICLSIGAGGARQNSYKDFPAVARATKRVLAQHQSTDLLFIFIGGNSEESAEPRIKHAGYIEDEHLLATYYQAANVLVHGAKVETSPLVILEAMACGIPTIASNVGGISELIKEGETGFLVPSGDSAILAERLAILMNNVELGNSLGKNASSVARNFSIDNQAKRYLQWFHELCHDQSLSTELPENS
jgi:glycosyltransferase involved in cell wall biosynthesis